MKVQRRSRQTRKKQADEAKAVVARIKRVIDTVNGNPNSTSQLIALYREALRAVTGATHDDSQLLPSAPPRELRFEGERRVLREPPLFRDYESFCSDLRKCQIERIKKCPYCSRYFYGPLNRKFCSNDHRSRHWQTNPENQDAIKGYEQKRSASRREARQRARKLREAETEARREARRMAHKTSELASSSKRGPRLPGGRKIK